MSRTGKKAFILLITALLIVHLPAQYKLYEDTFNGGVVTGGYSNGATVPSGSGSFNVNIPAGSTIRKAYLIAGRVGVAPDVTVTLNGTPYTFNASNIITTGFDIPLYGGNSSVNAIDVTAFINPATLAYTIAVPVQNTVSNKYAEFYLYIAFNNGGLPPVSTAIWFNTLSITNVMNWTLNTTTPIATGNPVGLAMLAGYAASGSDCENVNVNGTAIGNFSGMDFNASSAWGAMAGFQYYSNTLTGYNDDNANQAMSGPDALSNIAAIITNNTTSVPVTFSHCGGGSDNNIWATFLAWGGVIALETRLLSFDAKLTEENSVVLDWRIEGKDEIEKFVIERSAGNNLFQPLNESSPGIFLQPSYSYTDKNPLQGESWYRLKYTGANGAVRYSEAVSIVLEHANNIVNSYYPNPVKSGEDFYLDLNCEEGGTYSIVQMADGKEVAHGILSDEISSDQPGKISTSSFVPGVYIIKVSACSVTENLIVIVK